MKEINKLSALVGGFAMLGTLLSGGIWLISSANDAKNGTTNAATWKRNTYILGGISLISLGAFAFTQEKK